MAAAHGKTLTPTPTRESFICVVVSSRSVLNSLNTFFGFEMNVMSYVRHLFSMTTGCARCHAYRVAPALQLAGVGVGAAVLDQWAGTTSKETLEGPHTGESSTTGRTTGSSRTWSVPTTARAIGLLHFAAAGGHPEAHLALGLR